MIFFFYLPYIVLGFLGSYSIIKLFFKFFENYLKDIPNKRSAHKSIKPRGGGIVFIIFALISAKLTGNTLPILCIPISIVGLIDDFLNLPILLRLFAQFSSCLFILKNSLLSTYLFSNIDILKVIYIIVLLILMTGIVNFVNFMDGLDGLVAGCMIVLILLISFTQSSNYLIIIGSLLGFIILNWHPSKIFMGDVGSMFLGSFLAGSIINMNNIQDGLGVFFASSVLILDPLFCLYKRFKNKQRLGKAHQSHLYQRLYKEGINVKKISLMYIVSTFILSLLYMISGIKSFVFTIPLLIILGLYLDREKAKSF
tara:strand:- start:558 stop:1493 length:936 start_codon:yes stop_codon:yes gene_type:complete